MKSVARHEEKPDVSFDGGDLDCGFATFADNPICSHPNAEAKLSVIAQAVERFRA